jgi:4-amino-4-deoxy-L-arabinose transferase-like glycosyltransferase
VGYLSRSRSLAIVVFACAAFRLAFILWGLSGARIYPRYGMSDIDFAAGYAIAAGYGYVNGPPRSTSERLNDMDPGASADKLRLTPTTPTPNLPEIPVPVTIHPPGLALLVAGVHRLVGTGTDRAVEMLGALLDMLSAALVFWIAGRFFGPRVAFAAGLCHALFLPFGYWSTVAKSSDGLLGVFVIGAFACGLQAMSAAGRSAAAWTIAAGCILGAGCYLRPDYMMLPIAAGLLAGLRTGHWRRVASGAILAQSVVLLLLVPWAWRNYLVTGRWIFTSTSVGATLVTGLGEFENPWGLGGSDQDRGDEARAIGQSDPFLPAADLHFRRVFWDKVRERPDGYLLTIIRRLPLALATPYTFGLDNPWKTQTFTEARRAGFDRYQAVQARPLYVLKAYWDRILMAFVTLACTLSTIWMLVLERRRTTAILLLLGPHLYSIGTHLLTHLEPRYLLPSMSFWLIGLAYVLARGWRDQPRDAGSV